MFHSREQTTLIRHDDLPVSSRPSSASPLRTWSPALIRPHLISKPAAGRLKGECPFRSPTLGRSKPQPETL